MIEILISVTCAMLLVFLVVALIFKDKFRGDVLGHEGEATIFGLVTVKGVAIVLLSALFVGGMIYPVANGQAGNNCSAEVSHIGTLVGLKYLYEIEEAANKTDRSTLEKIVKDLQLAVNKAEQCVKD